jgi:ribosome-binding protein aMBF1 (putative translation factor)
MAPKGPILPRKDSTAANARAALSNTAYQVGVLLAIQRNRVGLRQEDLADQIGRTQSDISALERGEGLGRPLTEGEMKKLFRILELSAQGQLREFLSWWQRHGPR